MRARRAIASLAIGFAWAAAVSRAGAAEAADIGQAGTARGAAVFSQNCRLCHQSGAVGVPGSFPRLAGRVAAISAKPAGRVYLIDVLTYGMLGTISVDRQSLTGLMPPFPQLSAELVAAVLSYVQTLGDQPPKAAVPYSAYEVAAERARPAKAATQVRTERLALEKARIVE